MNESPAIGTTVRFTTSVATEPHNGETGQVAALVTKDRRGTGAFLAVVQFADGTERTIHPTYLEYAHDTEHSCSDKPESPDAGPYGRR